MKRFVIAGLGIFASVALAGAAFAASTTSVTGTLECSYCYLTMGAHGPSHKKCAIECASKGIPVSLVDHSAHKIYILLPPKNKEAIPSDVISKMEDKVTVTGKEYSKDGINYLTVQSIK